MLTAMSNTQRTSANKRKVSSVQAEKESPKSPNGAPSLDPQHLRNKENQIDRDEETEDMELEEHERPPELESRQLRTKYNQIINVTEGLPFSFVLIQDK